MNKQKIVSVISISISIICTAILPSLLTTIIPLGYYPLAIIVSVFMAILLSLIYLFLNATTTSSNSTVSNFSVSRTHPAVASITYVNKLRIYAITTTNIVALFETMSFTVEECVVLVRYTPTKNDFYSDNYKNEIDAKIGRWKHMVDIGRIHHLTIIGYDNLPDNYYFIFDDKLLATGLIEFSSKDISGQSMSKTPTWFYSNTNTSDSHSEILSYIEHFDNYVKYHAQHGITFLDKYSRSD